MDLTNDTLAHFANEIKRSTGLKDFRLYLTNQGDIKLDMIAAPRDSLGQGMGTKAMQALTDLADSHGKRIILTTGQKDSNWGTTSSTRLVSFYRRFGFVPNKGRNKDFTISDSMYRMPRQHFKEWYQNHLTK